MTQDTIRVVAGILFLAVIAIIIMRRKNKKKSEDEF